jgi:hypothetical protein
MLLPFENGLINIYIIIRETKALYELFNLESGINDSKTPDIITIIHKALHQYFRSCTYPPPFKEIITAVDTIRIKS